MTKRAGCLRIGAALLGVALVYPGWLALVGAMQSRTTHVDVALVDGKDIEVPVHVGWPGRFTLKIVAKTMNGADLQGEESCLLDLPDPHSQPVPCEGMTDRLHLNFRLENRAGKTLVGVYGIPMEGRYQDCNREYAPFIGAAEMGNELLILEKLEGGDYRLQATAVHVPGGLVGAAPRMVLEQEESAYAALTVLPLLGLSALVGLAAVGMLLVGALTKPS